MSKCSFFASATVFVYIILLSWLWWFTVRVYEEEPSKYFIAKALLPVIKLWNVEFSILLLTDSDFFCATMRMRRKNIKVYLRNCISKFCLFSSSACLFVWRIILIFYVLKTTISINIFFVIKTVKIKKHNLICAYLYETTIFRNLT